MKEIGSKLRDLVLSGYAQAVDGIVVCLICLMLVVLLFSVADVVVSTYHMIPELKPSTFEEQDFRSLVETSLTCSL